jgi:hypothetical protein
MDLICVQRDNTIKARLLNATIGRITGKDYRPSNPISLINMSNSNHYRFFVFVEDCFSDHVTQLQEIVDSQVLNDTGDADYDAWCAQVRQEERDELAAYRQLSNDWHNEACRLHDVINAMTICMYDPNAAPYQGYIRRIISEAAKAIAHSNPQAYWA